MIEQLKARGHNVRTVPPVSISGCATAVLIDPNTGTRMAGADPRRDCYAFGVLRHRRVQERPDLNNRSNGENGGNRGDDSRAALRAAAVGQQCSPFP